MPDYQKDKLDHALSTRREAVRVALKDYMDALNAAVMVTDEDPREQRQHIASLAQAASAQRVLWMD